MPDRRLLDVFLCREPANYEEMSQREEIRIPKFGYQVALEISDLATRAAREEFRDLPVAIDMTLANGHSLLRVGTDVGSALHGDSWNLAKRKTAMRFGCSSYFMGHQLREAQEMRKFLELRQYAFDGGAVPIFIDSCEFPVACMTVSGLGDCKNHWLAVESVRDYIIKINESVGKYTATDERGVDCGICMSELRPDRNYSVTPCNHIFHRQCLKTWGDHNSPMLDDQPKCPVCRLPMAENVWKRLVHDDDDDE